MYFHRQASRGYTQKTANVPWVIPPRQFCIIRTAEKRESLYTLLPEFSVNELILLILIFLPILSRRNIQNHSCPLLGACQKMGGRKKQVTKEKKASEEREGKGEEKEKVEKDEKRSYGSATNHISERNFLT